MFETLEAWAEAETPRFGVKWVLKRAARWILSLWWVRLMFGVRVYSNPNELKAHRSWSDVIKNIKTMDACFVSGHDALRNSTDISKINRLILPDPSVKSVKSYADAMGDNSLLDLIAKSTETAKQNGISVRWSREMIGYSFYIADRDHLDPYVHIEFAIPTMLINSRPSLTIKKKSHPKIFNEFVRTYERLWDRFSREPDDGTR